VSNEDAVGQNEVYVDRDIMVLANPEIAALPGWVIALVAAGGLAAALEYGGGAAAGDIGFGQSTTFQTHLPPAISDRGAAGGAHRGQRGDHGGGYLGIYPPGWVAAGGGLRLRIGRRIAVPADLPGHLHQVDEPRRRDCRDGGGAGFTFLYIAWFKLWFPELDRPQNWLFGISAEGIGVVGMVLNFAVAALVNRFTPAVPEQVAELVERIRVPRR
jgi:cation/acetate symporter